MKKLQLSPSALKAWLRCPRAWYLQNVKRVDRIVPACVTNGTTLDLIVQEYLKGNAAVCAAGSPELAELNSLLPELPAPGSVIVQQKFSLPCPGLEDSVNIMTGGLDFMTPPNLDLMVIGDLKRIWHKDAAMSAEQLAEDVQALTYAWFVYQVYNPSRVIWRWTYCVRETRNKETGKVTRKAKAFSVDQWADRDMVDAWFERVVLPAALSMLEVMRAHEAAEVEHDPTSCEEGARCFVRHHCPMYQGPVKGESNKMVDLSRFKTGKVPSLAEAVASGVHTRIAINPPALTLAARAESDETGAVSAAELAAYVATLPEPEGLRCTTIEGPGAALLAVEEDAPEQRETEPAPAPEPEPAPKARKRRARGGPSGAVAATAEPEAGTPASAYEAEKQGLSDFTSAELRGLSAHEREALSDTLSVEAASTEALVFELRDRGYSVVLTAGAL